MPRLNEQDRGIAIGMLQAGTTATAIARHFRCHVTTITRLRERHQQTGNVRDRQRSGRPRVTTPAQDRHIRVTQLPQVFFQRLVDSMRRRCTACIAANGGHTRYWFRDFSMSFLLLRVQCFHVHFLLSWAFFPAQNMTHFINTHLSVVCITWLDCIFRNWKSMAIGSWLAFLLLFSIY